MTSLTRKIKRNAIKNSVEGWPIRPQYTEWENLDKELSGYITLHPTKGWKRVSTKRVHAQIKMMQTYGFVK